MFFFTNGGAEANENAIKIARAYTGRHKILARYRSYHGATAGAIAAHGRSAALARRAGHARHRARARSVSRHRARLGHGRALAMLEEIIQLEGPQTIAAFILEPVTGTNGILVPPDGYLAGRPRALRRSTASS